MSTDDGDKQKIAKRAKVIHRAPVVQSIPIDNITKMDVNANKPSQMTLTGDLQITDYDDIESNAKVQFDALYQFMENRRREESEVI
ncbi:hypothetical protein GJ496_002566 [Pomphorhynchus laevis]|nr:hypothetical protein GJ496_002566 [Pomphorhynchus laevis]